MKSQNFLPNINKYYNAENKQTYIVMQKSNCFCKIAIPRFYKLDFYIIMRSLFKGKIKYYTKEINDFINYISPYFLFCQKELDKVNSQLEIKKVMNENYKLIKAKLLDFEFKNPKFHRHF